MHSRIRERRARVIRGSKRHRLVVALVLAVLIGGVGLAYGVAHSPIFTLRHISVHGGSSSLDKTVVNEADQYLGTNLFSISTQALDASISSSPLIGSVVVSRSYPDALDITVTARRIVAVLRQSPTSFMEVSASGVLVRSVPSGIVPKLPILCDLASKGFGSCATAVSPISVGGRIPSSIEGALTAAQAMDPSELSSYQFVGESPKGVLYLSDGGGYVCKLGSSSLISKKVRLCDAMKSAFGAGGGPSYVDVSAPSNPTAEPSSWLG